ncbi:MAG TPA: hypothetical protein DCE56_40990 [Cyanobacteria bacterium UBA8553]|nr:hypothetical protein [Cyanobacteria bacterium UBA8553]
MNQSFVDFLRSLSPASVEVLIRYSSWRQQVIEALKRPTFPFSYQPDLIEIFDQQGLLAGRINDYVYTVTLPSTHRSQFMAWYFDGELAFFSVGSDVIVNRLTLLSVAGLFDLPKKGVN